MSIKKNVQRTVTFKLVDATDFATPETGRAASANAFISKDGGAFVASTNKVSEISHGWYKLVLEASGMNADEVVLRVSDGTTSAQADRLLVTEDNSNKDVYDIVNSGTYGNSALKTKLDTVQEDTSELQADWANGGRLDTILDDVLEDTGTTIPAQLDTIQEDTSELQGDWTDGGRLDLLLDSTKEDSSELQGDWTNGGRLDLLIDAIKAKTDNLPGAIPKNVALSDLTFPMVYASDHATHATGLTITAEISKDGGAFGACGNSAAEISDGLYKIDVQQSEMNADMVALKFTAAAADQRDITIKTDA